MPASAFAEASADRSATRAPPPASGRSPSPAKAGEDWVRANSLTSWVIFIEQNLGPHIEQKWAVLAPSAGRVKSRYCPPVSGSRLNRSRRRHSKRAPRSSRFAGSRLDIVPQRLVDSGLVAAALGL